MKNMTLTNIAKAVSGIMHTNGSYNEKMEASDVVIDSRKATKGCIFVATRGERVDGHSFINQVFENGALGVICEEVPEDIKGPCIQVNDSFVALKELATYYRNQIDTKIVGIVGSVGKTSTKELVASVLSAKYSVHKTMGNFNNEIGVPLTLFGIRDSHDIAVVEMGISDFGEMDRLGAIVRPNVVVMTNIGPCHLENLKDLEGVLRAKSEVFKYVDKDGTLVLNKGDKLLGGIDSERALNRNILFYNEGGDVFATDPISFGLEGTSFMLNMPGGKIPVKVPLPGSHMVTNAVAAAAVGTLFNLSNAQIQTGIGSVEALGGRSRLIHSENYLIVDDCYNANPKSMKAAVDLMQDAKGRTVMILGDMFELGDDSDKLHAEVGSYASENGIDLLICCGESSKYMYEAACEVKETLENTSSNSEYKRENRTDILYFETKEKLLEALKTSKELLLLGDTILVKASHGMGFDEVVEMLH